MVYLLVPAHISSCFLIFFTWQDSGHYNCSSQRGLKNSLNLVVTGPADMEDDDDDVMMIGDNGT